MPDRALSTVLNYALMLVVVGVLVSGLLVGMNGYVGGEQKQVLRSELSVAGNHLAAKLSMADRLAGTVDDGSVDLHVDLFDRVAGQTYLVDIESAGLADRYALTLTTDDPSVSVTVYVNAAHPLETGRFHGGDLIISSDGTTLEVAHD